MANNNRKIIFSEEEKIQNSGNKVNDADIKKEILEKKFLPILQKRREELKEDLKKQYNSFLKKVDSNVIDETILEKKADYVTNMILLMQSSNSSGMLGIFGFDSDDVLELVINNLKNNTNLRFSIENDKDEQCKVLSKLPYIGCLEYREETPNIFLPISSAISRFLLLHEEYFEKYSYKSNTYVDGNINGISARFFVNQKYFKDFNEGNNIEFFNNDSKLSFEELGKQRKKYLNAYYRLQSSENFIQELEDFLLLLKYDTTIFLWIKAYKYDFDVFEKLYKLTKRVNMIVILTTLCDLNVVKEKIGSEIKCDGERIINKFFKFDDLITHIEV